MSENVFISALIFKKHIIFLKISIPVASLFTLLQRSILVRVSLRPSSQKAQSCSDWSALTGLSALILFYVTQPC